MIATYTAGRRLKMGADTYREPGLPVPEAHDWFRVEDWTHTGYLLEVAITEAAFRASVDEYIAPDERTLILSKVDLKPLSKTRKPVTAPVALKNQKASV